MFKPTILSKKQLALHAQIKQMFTPQNPLHLELKKLLQNLIPNQFTSSQVNLLAVNKAKKIITQEDAAIARELAILSKHLAAAEGGILHVAQNDPNLKFQFLNNDEFKEIQDRLTIKNHERKKATSEFLMKTVMKFTEEDLCSHAINRFASITLKKDKQLPHGAIIAELHTLAKLIEKAEKGKFQKVEMAQLNFLNKDEFAPKILGTLNKKNELAIAEQKEYGNKMLNRLVPKIQLDFFKQRADRKGQQLDISDPLIKYHASLPKFM